jgi:hypothetical protein
MSEEIALSAGRGNEGQVVRVGDTVHRPAGPWTPNVHAFLSHLRANGFDGCPEPLGFDDQGREILSFIPGEVVMDPDWDGGPTRWPPHMRTDETLARVGATVRALHDAAAGFQPVEPRGWRQYRHALDPGQIVCHADIGYWNTVHRPDGTIAFIDWDTIRPDDPLLNLADAAWTFVPLADEEYLLGTGWEEPPDVANRLRVFCGAYGVADATTVVPALHRAKEREPERFAWWPIGPAVAAERFDDLARQLRWLDDSAAGLARALE